MKTAPPTPPAGEEPHPRTLLLARLVLAALVIGVAWLAFDPKPPEGIDTGWDKLNHALAFAILMLAARFAALGTRWRPPALASALLAYGALIELVQARIPGRSADLWDLLADAVGIAVGALLWRAAQRRVRRKVPQNNNARQE